MSLNISDGIQGPWELTANEVDIDRREVAVLNTRLRADGRDDLAERINDAFNWISGPHLRVPFYGDDAKIVRFHQQRLKRGGS